MNPFKIKKTTTNRYYNRTPFKSANHWLPTHCNSQCMYHFFSAQPYDTWSIRSLLCTRHHGKKKRILHMRGTWMRRTWSMSNATMHCAFVFHHRPPLALWPIRSIPAPFSISVRIPTLCQQPALPLFPSSSTNARTVKQPNSVPLPICPVLYSLLRFVERFLWL